MLAGCLFPIPAKTQPDLVGLRYVWGRDKHTAQRRLLILAGEPGGIVIGTIEPIELTWELTLGVHRSPRRQRRINCTSLEVAMQRANAWAAERWNRLMKGY